MRLQRAADLVALAIALTAAAASAWVSDRVFERMPHVEDEFAFLWQAEVMADGALYTDSPPEARSFLVPFVVDHAGRRFGKYPPGWPAALALGAAADAAWLVNPVLAGLSIWFIYRLGSKIAERGVGLLAAALAAVSPMVYMLSGSLMGHNLSLLLAAAFTLAWLDLFPQSHARGTDRLPVWLLVGVAGSALGLLALTRPLTALGVAAPFGIHGLFLIRAGRRVRRRLLALGLLAGVITGLLPLWQAALSGDLWQNLYTLWWEYDRLGFGPGIGIKESGHDLRWAYINTRFSLRAGQHDLFGWPYLSWLFLPFGLLGLRRSRDAWLAFSQLPSLVLTYTLYWIGSWLFGPRYYYEALPGVAVISAAGVAWLAGWLGDGARGWARFRRPAIAGLTVALLAISATVYLPIRVGGMHGLYGMSRQNQLPLQTDELEGALLFVHAEEHWSQFGTLVSLGPPFTERDLLLVYSRGQGPNKRLADAFPERTVLHYYPNIPGQFFEAAQ